jgi:hypothetical protein
MKWVNEFGREIEWNPGDPWPTEDPEEARLRQIRYEVEQSGGYYCHDGDHYTYNTFAFPGCCMNCDDAVNRYMDKRI